MVRNIIAYASYGWHWRVQNFVMDNIRGEYRLPTISTGRFGGEAALRLGDGDMAAGRQPQPVGADEGRQEFLDIRDELLHLIVA